eukprot:TRINITY_DN8166_c0_g1_i9.p1 TRINITY_DN8166_c0_g1~~TRINITY_DN8166_c0_g1_i9.p1  ORF type:complete len:607 (-),score=85.15 TRINITY_DN8166_c0_g1_i9:9-1829(-)
MMSDQPSLVSNTETKQTGYNATILPCDVLADLENFRESMRTATLQFIKQQDDLFAAYSRRVSPNSFDTGAAKSPPTANMLTPLPLEDTLQGEGTKRMSTFSTGNENLQGTPAMEQRPSSRTSSRVANHLRRDGVQPSLKVWKLQNTQGKELASERVRISFEKSHFAKLCCISQFVHMLLDLSTRLETMEEPPRRGILAWLVLSPAFNFLCSFVIAANGVFILQSSNNDIIVSMQDHKPTGLDAWVLIDAIFSAFYVFELSLKLAVHRWHFFTNEDYIRNIIDVMLVVTGLPDLIAFPARADSRNLAWLRVFRLVKAFKAIRVFRTLRFFSDLRMMAASILGCFVPFVGCIALLSFVLFAFSVFFAQALALCLERAPDDARDALQFFGTVERSMLTLFAATTGGEDWRRVYEVVMKLGVFESVTFIFFIAFFEIAAWNIVTSIFVEKAMKLAQPDIELLLLEKQRQDLNDRDELKALIRSSLGDPGNERDTGRIGLNEFVALTTDTRFLNFFQLRGLDIKDAEMFYEMLASISDTKDVDLSTFVSGCLRMKGFATSIDLHSLSFETKAVLSRHWECMHSISSRIQKIGGTLHLMQSSMARLGKSVTL